MYDEAVRLVAETRTPRSRGSSASCASATTAPRAWSSAWSARAWSARPTARTAAKSSSTTTARRSSRSPAPPQQTRDFPGFPGIESIGAAVRQYSQEPFPCRFGRPSSSPRWLLLRRRTPRPRPRPRRPGSGGRARRASGQVRRRHRQGRAGLLRVDAAPRGQVQAEVHQRGLRQDLGVGRQGLHREARQDALGLHVAGPEVLHLRRQDAVDLRARAQAGLPAGPEGSGAAHRDHLPLRAGRSAQGLHAFPRSRGGPG